MNTKNILSILCILSILVFTFNLTSALTTTLVAGSNPTVVSSTATSLTFQVNVSNTNDTYSATGISLTGTTNKGTLSYSSSAFTLAANASTLVTATLSFTAGQFGTISISNVYASSTVNGNATTSSAFSLPSIMINNSYCRNGTRGDLEIVDFSLTNLGEGDDDEWQPLDEVDIEVKIKNTGDDNINDVMVEIKILDSDNNDVTDDFDLDDNEFDIGKINDGDREVATFKISSISSEIDEGDYSIFVKAYKDGSENSICVDQGSDLSDTYYQIISVSKEWDRAVIVKDEDLTTLETTCGSLASLILNFYNIGTEKEESVLLHIYNKELGLNQYQQISNLRADEKQEVSFDFVVPSNLTKTSYSIDLTTYFEYDDGDVLEITSYDSDSYDDLDKTYRIPVKIMSCSSNASSVASLTAGLASGTKTEVGSNMVVQTVVTNTGSSANTYTMSVSGYETWADLVSIEPTTTTTIAAGNSNTIAITLKPKQEGTKSFTIATTANGKITQQTVQVSIDANKGIISSMKNYLGTTGFYLVVAIVILIVIILLVLIIKLIFGAKKVASDF